MAVIFVVLLLTFLATRMMPGNPVDHIVSELADDAQRQRVIEQYGFDQPVHVQFIRYLGDLSRGDFGLAFSTGRDVFDDLQARLPATLELALYSLLIAVVLGILLGVVSAFKRNSWIDHLTRVVAVIGVSAPAFWVGLVLIQIFFVELRLVGPPAGRLDLSIAAPDRITGLYTADALITGNWPALAGAVKTLALPVITLAFSILAPVARMTRSEMIEVLETDYIRAAASLGIPFRTIVRRHALKNALLPVITMIGILIGYLMGGVVLVETVFAWPGLGFYAFQAATGADYYALQGFILYVTVIYVLVFLVLDIAYASLDPRIEL